MKRLWCLREQTEGRLCCRCACCGMVWAGCRLGRGKLTVCSGHKEISAKKCPKLECPVDIFANVGNFDMVHAQ